MEHPCPPINNISFHVSDNTALSRTELVDPQFLPADESEAISLRQLATTQKVLCRVSLSITLR
jgi:hypothetical protein